MRNGGITKRRAPEQQKQLLNEGRDHNENDGGRDPCDRWQQDPARSVGDCKSRVM